MGHGGVNIDTVKVDNPVQAEFGDNLSWVCPAIEEILFANPQLTFTTEDVGKLPHTLTADDGEWMAIRLRWNGHGSMSSNLE